MEALANRMLDMKADRNSSNIKYAVRQAIEGAFIFLRFSFAKQGDINDINEF